jgi:uncharacterized protein (TIGR02266 family)
MRCATWADYLELHTSNLSRGGLFVGSRVSAPIGTEIAIELSLPNATVVKLRGEVVHVTEEAAGQVGGMGIMFFGIDEEAKRALDEALQLARNNAPRPAPPPRAVAPPPIPKAAPPAPLRSVPPPVPPPAPVAAETGREPKFTDVVEQALLDELARRVDLGAHAQLGVAVDAGDADIEEAYARLKERYAPSIFARYGATTGAVVKSINDVIDTAHAKLLDPSERRALVIAAHQPKPSTELTPDQLEQKRRGEEARTALRAGIDRRVEEACAHRDMGRLDEAIRSFEAVITLDRKNDYAKEELRKLRDLKAKRKR